MTYDIFGEDERFTYLAAMLDNAGHKRTKSPTLGIFALNAPYEKCILKYGGKGFKYSDSYKTANSLLTAEGALSLAIKHTKDALCDSNILILGYGFLGKALASVFSPLVKKMTIATDDETTISYNNIKLKDIQVYEENLIINTIPAKVLMPPMIKADSPPVLLELASIPCTSDAHYNLTIINGNRLPARFCPRSGARLMFEDINNMIKEKNYE